MSIDAKLYAVIALACFQACRVACAEESVPTAEPRRLNNFVTELVNEPASDGLHRFAVPEGGSWVYISLRDAAAGVKATAGGFDAAPVLPNGFRESMRRYPAGDHAVTVAGAGESAAGRLVVRLVKRITHDQIMISEEETLNGPYFSRAFADRYFLGTYNTSSTNVNAGALAAPFIRRMAELGAESCALVRNSPSFKDGPARTLEKLEAAWKTAAGRGIQVDEVGINQTSAEGFAGLAGVVEEFVRRHPETRLEFDLCDVINETLKGREYVAPFLKAVLSSGHGTGGFATEHYLISGDSARDIRHGLGLMRDYTKSLRALAPEGPSRTACILGGYLFNGDWTPHVSPSVDYKFLLDRQMLMLATDEEYRDNGGVCVPRHFCDEEFARWFSALVRHYCIEGRTDSLADRAGFTAVPGFVKNGDFGKGLDGWQVVVAEEGSITVTNREKAAKALFGRIGAGGRGNSFALISGSAKGRNLLKQKLTGLVPGRVYALSFVTVDYDELNSPGKYVKDFAFEGSVTPSRPAAFGSNRFFWPYWDPRGRRKPKKPVVCTQKYVFEAVASEAELVLADGGIAGTHRMVNKVAICPYWGR